MRPYQEENTTSRPISEVKPLRARLVLGLETTREHRVSQSFFILSTHFSFLSPRFSLSPPPIVIETLLLSLDFPLGRRSRVMEMYYNFYYARDFGFFRALLSITPSINMAFPSKVIEPPTALIFVSAVLSAIEKLLNRYQSVQFCPRHFEFCPRHLILSTDYFPRKIGSKVIEVY